MPVSSVSVTELAAILAADPSVPLIDVRSPEEYVAGRVPGAVLIPMHTVPVRLDEIPRDTAVYLVCHSGGRSMQVAQWLAQQGYDCVNVEGGTAAWAMTGHPIET